MVAVKTRGPLRLLSVIVFVVLALSTLAATTVVSSIVEDQNNRILRDRTEEAGALLTMLFAAPRTTLPLLGATTLLSHESTDEFIFMADKLRGTGSIGAVQVDNGAATVVAVVGEGPAPKASVDPVRSALASAALERQSASGIVDDNGQRLLTLAVKVSDELVLYQDIPLTNFADYKNVPEGPFTELTGTVYASDHPDPAAVVISTAEAGSTPPANAERQVLDFGTEKWLLVAWSDEPQVGSFANNAPWAVLAVGLLGTLLTTFLVESLSRRRAYAMALVDERTGALQDSVAEQARLREVAEAANRSKSEFLSRMSHELRTPLNAVLGFGQLLELDPLTESQDEAVSQILNGGRHLLHLIDEILDIARIEAGTLAMSPESVLVSDVVADTLSLMRPLAEQRDIRIFQSSVVDAHAHADRQRLKQILLNLLSNAVKYNRHGGSVTVAAAVEDDRVRLSVTDTGMGIPAEHLDRLFVPFDRLGAERTEVDGAGVGLALSRRLAEAMGGTIRVVSTYGEGSTFVVELPLADDPIARYDRMAAEQPSVAWDREAQHTILYIEDNLSNVRLVERVLEQQRPDVKMIPAMQGRLGVALAHEHRPQLILLDLHLPDIDGERVLRELKADAATADIPVVIISADATSRQIERLLEAGALAYLTKPLEVREFLGVVAQTVGAAV